MGRRTGDKGYAIRTAQADYTSGQTDTSLIAAPGVGYSIHVHSFELSSDVDGAGYLEHGTTQIGREVRAGPAADGQWAEKDYAAAANTAVTITTDIAGNHSVLVEYSVRQRGDIQRPSWT